MSALLRNLKHTLNLLLPPTLILFPLNDLIPPFIDLKIGVEALNSNVMYGEPGTKYDVNFALP